MVLRVPRHLTFEDVLKREFWSQSPAASGRDKIIVMREDGGFYIELIVFAVGINWAEVEPSPTRSQARAPRRCRAADDFEVKYGGLIKNWIVVRRSDGVEIKVNGTLMTQEAAQAWLAGYIRTLTKGGVA